MRVTRSSVTLLALIAGRRGLLALSLTAASKASLPHACLIPEILDSYMAFSATATVLYAFPCHWVWADGGWLNVRGFHDFAGDGPVHLFGACNALAGAMLVGPRTGRWDPPRLGQTPKFGVSSPSSVIFGLFMLWWGWIGFSACHAQTSRRAHSDACC